MYSKSRHKSTSKQYVLAEYSAWGPIRNVHFNDGFHVSFYVNYDSNITWKDTFFKEFFKWRSTHLYRDLFPRFKQFWKWAFAPCRGQWNDTKLSQDQGHKVYLLWVLKVCTVCLTTQTDQDTLTRESGWGVLTNCQIRRSNSFSFLSHSFMSSLRLTITFSAVAEEHACSCTFFAMSSNQNFMHEGWMCVFRPTRTRQRSPQFLLVNACKKKKKEAKAFMPCI